MALLANCLQKVRPPVTREKIVAAIKTLKAKNFQGILLDYDDSIGALSKKIWINPGYKKAWLGPFVGGVAS